MPALDPLLDDLFAGRHAALRAEFDGWLRGSRRFAAFAETYRGKIRAKLRHAQDADGLRDVRAELEVAALLLGEERFAIEYEKYAAAKQRGPDFTVTFKTHTPFNVGCAACALPRPMPTQRRAPPGWSTCWSTRSNRCRPALSICCG